jgi:hypothetical protein
MRTPEILATGTAALLFALAFLFGGRVHPLQSVIRDRRTITSFGAGIAVAYVFVQVIPELHEARQAFAKAASAPLPYEGMVVFFFSLVGFLVFYGLEHLRRKVRAAGHAEGADHLFRLHLAGFAAYVWLVSYQLVEYLHETQSSVALYAVAMSFHFVGVDHLLREEHGARYDRIGRHVLAAMCAAGWAAGLLVSVPAGLLALSVAFVSGAIIMNSCLMELPAEKDGRFVPFLAGGLLYGLVLLPLG